MRSFVLAFVRRERFEDAMADEMKFHLDAYADDLVRSGLPRGEAMRRARLEFGGVETAKDDCRRARGLRLADELVQDLRYATRMMKKMPAFTAAAVLSIALGIGANTAIFSLTDAVLLRTLPIAHPQSLYFFGHGPGEFPRTSSNYPLLERYRQRLDVFDGITAYYISDFKVMTPRGADLVAGQFVSGNYHALLGVPFVVGRGFASLPDTPSDAGLVATISEGYWARQFARDPAIVGKSLVVQGRPVTIVGVTAAGFDGLKPGTPLDITLPLSVRVMERPDFLTMHDTWTGLNIVGRLKPGVTEADALAGTDAVFKQYIAEPDNEWAWKKASAAARTARLVPAGRGSGALRSTYTEPLRVLTAIVTVVLLIACCNVASLLLVRASARGREVAVRLSVGAGRARIVRQLLTESVLLAICGGAVGLLLAMWGTASIVALLQAGRTPIVLDVSPNARVLAFTAAVSMAAGVVFGLVPAFGATRIDVAPTLRKNGPATARFGGRHATGRLLVAAQIALCILTLAGAGLLARSLRNLKTLDAGVAKANLLLFYADTRGSTTSVVDLHERLLDRLRAIPGVQHASICTTSPLSTNEEQRGIRVAGFGEPQQLWNNLVTPDYFSTFGVTILRGRALTASDTAASPRVAVVSEAAARAYFGDADPLGRTFAFTTASDRPVTIVGVARDARQRSLREAPLRLAYTPLVQADEPPSQLTAAVRAAQDPRTLEAPVRDAARRVSPDLVVSYVRTFEEQVDATLVRDRLLATLSAGFALLSLVLACVGLYGVMTFDVTRRAREIAIRIALGAGRAAVIRGVLRTSLSIAAAGIAAGLGAAWAATRVLSAFLFEVSSRDPLTLGATALVLLATLLVAAWAPARRAATVDPIAALKSE